MMHKWTALGLAVILVNLVDQNSVGQGTAACGGGDGLEEERTESRPKGVAEVRAKLVPDTAKSLSNAP
jgi:hypothetical protein